MGQHDIGDYFQKRVSGYSEEINTDEVWDQLNLGEERKKKGFFYFLLGGLSLVLMFVGANLLLDTYSANETIEKTEYSLNRMSEKTSNTHPVSNSRNQGTKKAQETKTFLENQNTKAKPASQPEITFLAAEKAVRKTNNLISVKSKKLHQTKHNEKLLNNNLVSPLMTLGAKVPNKNKEQLSTPNKLMAIEKIETQAPNTLSKSIRPTITLELSAIDLILPSPEKANQSYSASVYSGIFFLSRQLDPIFDELDSHIELRNSSETQLEMFSAGIELSYHLRSGFYSKLGLEYQALNELFQHQQTSSETNISTNEFISTFSEKEIIEEWKNYNSHKLYTIPLSLGYSYNLRKWSIGIEGAFLFNFSSEFNGKQLNIFNEVVDVSIIQSDSAKLGYRAGLIVARQLSPKCTVYMSPIFQKYTSSFTQSITGYNQYYSMYGGQLGLRHNF